MYTSIKSSAHERRIKGTDFLFNSILMSFNLKPEPAYTANTQPVRSSFAIKAIMDLEQGPRFSASVMLLNSNWILNMLNIQSGQEDGKKELQPATPHRPQDSRPVDRGSRSVNRTVTWWLWKCSVNKSQVILWSCCCWFTDSFNPSYALFTVDDCSPIGPAPTGFCSPPPDRGEAAVKLGLVSLNTARRTLFFLCDVAMPPSPKASMWSHVSCSASFCVDPGIKTGITFKDCIYKICGASKMNYI